MSDYVTPLKAIRAYCLGCMCNQPNEVKLCPIKNCELYDYRFGTNPHLKPRQYTDAQKANMRERGRQAQEKLRAKRLGNINTLPDAEKEEK